MLSTTNVLEIILICSSIICVLQIFVLAARSNRILFAPSIAILGFPLIQFLILYYATLNHISSLMFSGTLNLVCTFVAIIFLYSLGQKLRKSSTDEIDLIEVFAQLPGHVYWKDRNYIFKGSNINNWQDFGASSLEEILGKTDYDIFSKEQADMIRANDEEVLRSGCLQVIEEPATNPDGSTTLYLSYKVPVKDKIGKSVGLLGISIDITQAKRDVEDKLKKILEDIIASMPGHVYWVDINGVYLGCNDNQAKSAGLNSRNEIVGKRNKDLPWNSNVNEIVNFLDTVNQEIITKRITLSLEEPAVLNNTKAVFLSIKSPLYNTVGEVVGMVGTSIDITDRKKAETIRQEEQSNFRKTVEQAIHDIRSPLTGLQMLTQACEEIPEKDRVAIREAIISISDIANNLLNKYSPPQLNEYNNLSTTNSSKALLNENNKAPFQEERQPVLVATTLLQLIADKKYLYQNLPVKFEYNFAKNSHFAFIKVEPNSFKRMLSNLINNAVEALQGKPGTVTVSLEAITSLVRIKIQDTGSGMPAELVDKIKNNVAFTHGKENGHGIGMQQVHDMLERNRGVLEVESTEGKGTTFTINFLQVATPEWICNKLTIKKNSIVIILDDEQSIHGAWDSRFNSILVRYPEIQIIHFRNGQETIDYINSKTAEERSKLILLTDYELLKQTFNGLEVAEQTQIEKQTILVTSHHSTEYVLKTASAMKVKVLPKLLASELLIIV